MARPRKPTALKVLHGDFEKDPQRENKREPQPKKGRPRCPKHLGKIARYEWFRICKELSDMTVLTKAERAAIEQYCIHYERHRFAYEQVKKHGSVIPVKDKEGNVIGMRTSPYDNQLRTHGTACQKLLSEFGLTPSSRSRLQIEQATTGKNDIEKKYLA